MKVKIFCDTDIESLEIQINKFLTGNIKLHSIKMSEGTKVTTILILYTEL